VTATVYVGLVEGPEQGVVTAAVLDDAGHGRGADSFSITPNRVVLDATTGVDYDLTPELMRLEQFLRDRVPEDGVIKVLLAVPSTVTHEVLDDGAVPNGVLPPQSALLPVVLHLACRGFVTLRGAIGAESTGILASPVLGADLDPTRPSPRYLAADVCTAYAELLGRGVAPEDVASVAAGLAKDDDAFYFWSSIGAPPSSIDLVSFLRLTPHVPSRFQHIVLAATEMYCVEVSPQTPLDTARDIPLKYALAEKRYEHLGANDAAKAGVLDVCQRWRLLLRCSSRRQDAVESRSEVTAG